MLHNAVNLKYSEFLMERYIVILMCDIFIELVDYAMVIM